MVTQDRDTERENLDERKQGFSIGDTSGQGGEDPEPPCSRATWIQCVRVSCQATRGRGRQTQDSNLSHNAIYHIMKHDLGGSKRGEWIPVIWFM